MALQIIPQMDSDKKDNHELELDLLLEAIHTKYGYDFKNYSRVHIRRRIRNALKKFNSESILHLTHRIIYNEDAFIDLLHYLSVNVTEMFRDPAYYLALRTEVVPILKTYPFIKIWHAGCATGQEVYSMAILLQEEELYERVQMYATDFNKLVVNKAQEGIFPIEQLKTYTKNYHAAGGENSFSKYYHAKYDAVKFSESLKKNVVFASHNLVTDSGFGEMHSIICRNVLIYFDRELQTRVLKLFYDNLVDNGFLCLGSKETIRFSGCEHLFETVDEDNKIYRKKF